LLVLVSVWISLLSRQIAIATVAHKRAAESTIHSNTDSGCSHADTTHPMTQTNRQANNSRGEHFDRVYPRGRVLYSQGEHFDVLYCMCRIYSCVMDWFREPVSAMTWHMISVDFWCHGVEIIPWGCSNILLTAYMVVSEV
jgi:hypothetical protein